MMLKLFMKRYPKLRNMNKSKVYLIDTFMLTLNCCSLCINNACNVILLIACILCGLSTYLICKLIEKYARYNMYNEINKDKDKYSGLNITIIMLQFKLLSNAFKIEVFLLNSGQYIEIMSLKLNLVLIIILMILIIIGNIEYLCITLKLLHKDILSHLEDLM